MYRLPSLSLIDFLQCAPLIGCQKNTYKFACLGQLAGIIFPNHRQVPVSVFRVKIAASEPLKRVPSNFVEEKGSKKFTIQYPNSKLFKNDENHKRTHKILYLF
jgi:hypothetical protein